MGRRAWLDNLLQDQYLPELEKLQDTTWKVNGVAHPETMMKSSLEQSTLCIGR
jgi:hypothetical protein